MGLYLCVFEDGEELEGVEIGSYADFNFFRDAITVTLEQGKAGSVCPTLINHHDCDGSWSPEDCAALVEELKQAEQPLMRYPPVEFNSPWKRQVAKLLGISPKSLAECFFDVDGEPLIARLRQLAEISKERNVPVLFQ